jgi:integrase
LTVQAAYAKSGESRIVPLNSVLRDALKHLQLTSRGDFVFQSVPGRSYTSINKAFRQACQVARLSNVSLHTLRHTFASRLVMASVDLRTVQDLGGWRSLQRVERYAHLSAQHKRMAVEKICRSIPNAITTLMRASPAIIM